MRKMSESQNRERHCEVCGRFVDFPGNYGDATLCQENNFARDAAHKKVKNRADMYGGDALTARCIECGCALAHEERPWEYGTHLAEHGHTYWDSNGFAG
tara:strand:- start:4745 stop:5041 length:297 start_codon:yes stop_codon:yes gene_type:complete